MTHDAMWSKDCPCFKAGEQLGEENRIENRGCQKLCVCFASGAQTTGIYPPCDNMTPLFRHSKITSKIT